MVYTSFPVTVDGVSLDSYAWGIDVKTRQTADTRPADVAITGVDGMAASLGDDLNVMQRTYSMWVLGVDSTGAIPGGQNGMSQCLANLDALTYLFSRRHRLMDVQETVGADGTMRQYWSKRAAEPIVPTVVAGGLGRFTVSLVVPSGLGQDVSTADWSQTNPTSTVFYEVTTLAGATGSLTDAVVLVKGPANNPRVTDSTTGSWVQLNAVLSSTQYWRLNVGTWSSRYGTSLTLSSLDTDGTDGAPITTSGGTNSASYLVMEPALSGGVRRTFLSLTAAGTTSATALSVRARRKFLL